MGSLQEFITAIGGFINDTLIPFLFIIAFLVFIVNIFRYFIIGSTNETVRKTARTYAIWSIAAFVLMISVWGIVNMIVNSLNLGNTSVCPDYIENTTAGCDTPSPNSSGNNWGWTNNPSGEFGQ